MAFQTQGTPITQRVTFNSGYLDFGANELVNVDNIKLTVDSTLADLNVINSIIAQDKVRHTMTVKVDFKVKNFSPEIEAILYGKSASGSPNTLSILDGQPTFQNPVLTVFDRNGKEIQFQLTNALIKSSAFTSAADAYGEWDFELEATNIQLLYTE
jgi:hypothetical protein